MSTRQKQCKIIVCDGCGRDYENGDYTPHWDSADEGREETVNYDWRTDGVHDWCEPCQSQPHDCTPDPNEQDVCVRCDAEIETAPSNEGDRA